MFQISKRLHTISTYIPKGAKVADIGSDHAYLPTYLVESGISSYVVAGEVNEGPFQSARQQVAESGLESFIDVRKGDGLSVLQAGEVDTVVIAGMGGSLIAKILEAGIHLLKGVKRLVLQPNVGEENVRRFALTNNWELIGEEIIEEEGKIYEILCFIPGDGEAPYRQEFLPKSGHIIDQELLLKLGPFLSREQSQIFHKKWHRELQGLQRVIESLSQSTKPESMEKKQRLLEEYRRLKEVLQ